jgi:hypothetical protein
MHKYEVFNSLSRGTPLAAAIEASEQQLLAWVGVYPLDLSEPMTHEFLRNNGIDIFPSSGRAYRIRTLEVQRKLIDADASIGGSELENKTSKMVFSDDDLVRALEELGVAVEDLELHYNSDYPI